LQLTVRGQMIWLGQRIRPLCSSASQDKGKIHE
jgi:hypothetical protein